MASAHWTAPLPPGCHPWAARASILFRLTQSGSDRLTDIAGRNQLQSRKLPQRTYPVSRDHTFPEAQALHLRNALSQMIDRAQLACQTHLPDGHQVVGDGPVQIAGRQRHNGGQPRARPATDRR